MEAADVNGVGASDAAVSGTNKDCDSSSSIAELLIKQAAGKNVDHLSSSPVAASMALSSISKSLMKEFIPTPDQERLLREAKDVGTPTSKTLLHLQQSIKRAEEDSVKPEYNDDEETICVDGMDSPPPPIPPPTKADSDSADSGGTPPSNAINQIRPLSFSVDSILAPGKFGSPAAAAASSTPAHGGHQGHHGHHHHHHMFLMNAAAAAAAAGEAHQALLRHQQQQQQLRQKLEIRDGEHGATKS